MLRFEWNEDKNEGNLAKHGVDFNTARLVFDDPCHVAFVSNFAEGEERWTAIGSVEGVIVLVVIHTYQSEPPDEIVRIISARRATTHERRLYEQAGR